MDRWTEMEVLVQIAETGTLSGAADALGLSTSSASRYLASLEDRLGASLVMRNTRRLQLTEAGRAYLARVRATLAQLADADAAVGADTAEPRGVLRVSASVPFAVRHIAPLLRGFTERHPQVTLQIVASNRYVDLIDSQIDVAVRNREFEPDSAITIRRLARTRRVLAASPAYLLAHGAITHPHDLVAHPMLVYSHANSPHELRFERGDDTLAQPVRCLLESDDADVLRAAALSGLGPLVLPAYILHDDLHRGALVPLLSDWSLPSLTINLAYVSRRHVPAKVRCFIDFMCEVFEREDFEARWLARDVAAVGAA
ncbi:MAG: LysR family transcriptional regulator [Hydrogenophaga sp.]|nr:LysR family transcriptional regulator [Hydrogenophaga sp.]